MDIKEISGFDYKTTERHPWELARAHIVFNLLKKQLEKKKNKEVVIFDIGCGDTFLASYILSKIPNACIFAVDQAFTPEHIEKLTIQLNNNKIILYRNIEELLKHHDKKADFVLLLDVIEHIEDDISFLASLLKIPLVTEKTDFIITVPSYSYLFGPHDIFLGHYRRYTPKSLKNSIIISGLKPERRGNFFFTLYLLRLFDTIIVKTKIKRLKDTDSKGIGHWKYKRLTILIKYFLLADYYLFSFLNKAGIRFPGLSLYMVCKKHVL